MRGAAPQSRCNETIRCRAIAAKPESSPYRPGEVLQLPLLRIILPVKNGIPSRAKIMLISHTFSALYAHCVKINYTFNDRSFNAEDSSAIIFCGCKHSSGAKSICNAFASRAAV